MVVTARTVEVVQGTLNGLGMALTTWRLVERARKKKLGVDDIFAAMVLVIAIIFVVSFELRIKPGMYHYTRLTRFSLYYVLGLAFYGLVWACRISIMATLRRIAPPGRFHIVFTYIMYIFAAIWVMLNMQLVFICERGDSKQRWKDKPIPQCPLDGAIAITQIVADIFADLVLVASSIRLFTASQGLSRRQRQRLTGVFCACLATTVASMVHAYYVLRVPGGFDVILFASVETGISLIVMNLAVVVGVVSRVLDDRQSRSEPHGHTGSLASRLVWHRPANAGTLDIALQPVQQDGAATSSMPKSGSSVDGEDHAFALKATAWPTSNPAVSLGVMVTKEVRHDVDAV